VIKPNAFIQIMLGLVPHNEQHSVHMPVCDFPAFDIEMGSMHTALDGEFRTGISVCLKSFLSKLYSSVVA
jgi:hypothetical protein